MARRSWEWPAHEVVVATSMLLGEPSPVICSCCLGRHVSQGLFMMHTCGQCNGCGYDIIGAATAEALKYEEHELPAYIPLHKNYKGQKR